jgi:hypothetical protein
MKTKIIFFAVIIIAVVLAVVFLRGGVKPPIETSTKFPYSSPTKVTGGDKPTSPMQSVLTIIEKPLLNVPVPLVFSFKSVTPAPNTEAKIELPDGFALVSGTPTWNGDLEMNEERKIEVIIKSTKVGYYRLSGSAISRQGESFFGDTAIIDIEITPDDAIAGSKPENNWYHPAQGQGLPLAQNNEQIQSELIFSNTPELGKSFTITYKVMSLIKLPSQRTYLFLVFPPKAFKLISVQFPQSGETYQSDTQLSWIGNIDVNQMMEIVATFEVVNVGSGTVYGNLNSQSGKGGATVADLIVDVKTANLYVDKYGGKFTE